MFEIHGRVFSFSPKEIGCVDLYDAHVPWNIKSIPMTRTHIPKLLDLLKEKSGMAILDMQCMCLAGK